MNYVLLRKIIRQHKARQHNNSSTHQHMKNIILIIATLMWGQIAIAQCNMDRHNSNAYDGWVSCQMTPNPNSANGTTHWIMYDLGETKSLYTSQFWNINHPDHLAWGVRTVRIEHSMDNINWASLGDFTIQQGSGQQIYEGEEGPDFGALTTRYLLFTVLNTYGDNSCAGFGELKIFTQDEQLPAGLLAFTGNEVDCQVKLEWRTATEENTDYFAVQKSTDGVNFTTITQVPAFGNSTAPIRYRHTDVNPSDENYYRLKTVDRDGQFAYSNIVQVNSLCYEGGTVDVFPNPVRASEALNIRFHANEIMNVNVEIMDGLGRIIDRMEMDLNEGVNTFTYDAANLPAGMYTLRFSGADWLPEAEKFMKVD